MARVIDAKYCTLIGTARQLRDLLGLLRAEGATVIDLKFSNLVVLDKPIDRAKLREALESTPRTKR